MTACRHAFSIVKIVVNLLSNYMANLANLLLKVEYIFSVQILN